MKQKTIIQFWGTNGIGKSETIKILYQELVKRYIDPTYTYIFPFPPPSHDISKLINCKGYKVGMESMGDFLYLYNLKTRLDKFVITDQVELLICASRVRNDVSAHLQLLAKTHGYRIVKVTPYNALHPAFSHDDLNQSCAANTLPLIDDILNGTI